VAPIVSFKDEADAIRLANGTPYGLASYFYSRDLPASSASPRRWISAWSRQRDADFSKPRLSRDQAFRSGARGLALWSR